MARFFTRNGAVGLAKHDGELSLIPAGATIVADFDESTNAATIADFDANCARFTVVGGQLRRDGVAVVFAADSSTKTEINDLLDQAAAAITSNNTYLAIGSPSNAQSLAQIRALTQQNNRIIRRLVRLGKLKE